MKAKVNLAAAFAQIQRPWTPAIVGELNGQYVKIARFEGAYVWHRHADEDELFWVVSGALRIEFRDRTVELLPGEFFVVPRGVEHRPVADGGAEVVLFEPKATCSTGDAGGPHTLHADELQRL